MSSGPLNPGEIKLSYTSQKLGTGWRSYHHPPRKPTDPPLVALAKLVGLVVLAMFLAVVLPDHPSHSYSDWNSPWVSKTIALPARPALPGRYAAFVWSQGKHETRAIVIKYAKVQIKTVGRGEAIALDGQAGQAFDLNGPSARDTLRSNLELEQTLNDDKLKRGDEINKTLAQVTALLQETKTGPYLIHGDVTIEIGPLVNEDALISRLVSQNGDLKAASIDVVNGAPRGPPSEAKFDSRPVYSIYVAGRITKFSGPIAKDRSSLYASIIDLCPSSDQLDKYIADAAEWRAQIKSRIGNAVVSEDELWDHKAGQDFTVNGSIYDRSRDPLVNGGRDPEGRYEHEYHPVEHAIP
jgi:hypothetical protein